jgi:hypothetical protein
VLGQKNLILQKKTYFCHSKSIYHHLKQASMRLEKYKLRADETLTAFEFTSEGPNGHILKCIEYTKVKLKGFKNVYNLGFGDKLPSSEDIDDKIVSDNQDRDKILATVASTVVAFISSRPKAKVFIIGSNQARTRLYRMAINKYFDELSYSFNIRGFLNEKWQPFEKNINYEAFLISRKTN